MNVKAVTTATIGAGIVLLGLLWLLQGADLVHVRPIVCFADCEPLIGGSAGWLIAGVVGIIAGALLIRSSARRAQRS
jgi:hypothetical protein